MKRIIPLMLLVALCLTLIACTEAELPEVNEEIQGEEIQEEIEGETPEETPEEPVVPEEPETPDDIPEEPNVPEEPEEVIDYIKITVERDGEVREKIFDLSGLEAKPYEAPELTAPEDFDLGEYGLFVGMETGSYSTHGAIFSYGIITDETDSINEAVKIYDRLNEKYKINYPINETLISKYEYDSGKAEKVKRFLFESKIVYISEEADTLGNLSMTAKDGWVYDYGDDENDHFMNKYWDTRCDIIDPDGNIIYTAENENIEGESLEYGGFEELTRYYFGRYCRGSKFYIDANVSYENNIRRDDNVVYKKDHLFDSKKEPLMKINTETNLYCTIEDYDGEDIILLNIIKERTSITYILELNTFELFAIGEYMYNPIISLDKKYVAFVNDVWAIEEMKCGIYIRNLASGETVFFDCIETLADPFICNWINTNNIMGILE